MIDPIICMLIIFFIVLLICQVFIVEGFTNSNGNSCSQLSIMQQLLSQIQDLSGNIQDLSGNVQTLQGQVNGLAQSQQQYADQLTGGTAPQITGT